MARAICYGVLLLLGLGLAAALNARAPLISNVGWWKTTSFYQIYPRSFMDSDGDGIGDLKGITEKLEYFNDTGIGAIWLSPIYKSPMVDFGYDISNFIDIAPEYGNMTDFEALTAKAKDLELKVILDLVPNHASDEHEWFNKSAKNETGYSDYFIWRDGRNPSNPSATPPNNWISVFGGPAWTWHDTRKQWYFHQFHKKQPDLNYNSHAVRKEMANVIRFWLGKGVDGFRVDAVPHLFEVEDLRDEPLSNNPSATSSEYTYLNHLYTKDQPETYDLVKSWRQILDLWAREEGGDERIMMTEAYTGLDKTVEFYDAGAHIPFNFKFIIDVNQNSTPNDFKKVIDDWTTEANKRNGTSNWVMGNHDRSRIETRYPGRGDQMTMLAMILPGVSVTYYGEEIGMVDKSDISFNDTQDPQGCQAGADKFKEKSRDPCRTPFQWDSTGNSGFSSNKTAKTWLPVNDNYDRLNLDAQKKANESHYHIFISLTKLKRTDPALQTGALTTVVKNSNQALAILRTHNNDTVANHTVLLVINFSTANQTVDLTSDIPTNLALKGVVKVATLDSTLKKGASVDLTKVHLDPKNALVIITDQERTADNNEKIPNGGDSSAISFIKAAIILAAALLITFS